MERKRKTDRRGSAAEQGSHFTDCRLRVKQTVDLSLESDLSLCIFNLQELFVKNQSSFLEMKKTQQDLLRVLETQTRNSFTYFDFYSFVSLKITSILRQCTYS